MTTDDPGDLARAARDLLIQWEAIDVVRDADMPHVVIQIEPEAGTRQAVGPFPDAYTALLATTRMRAEIGEPIKFEIMPIFSAPTNEGGQTCPDSQ